MLLHRVRLRPAAALTLSTTLEVRRGRPGLSTACGLVVEGALLHRLNVAVIGLRGAALGNLDAGLTGRGRHHAGHHGRCVFEFGVLARILPIHEGLSSRESRHHAPPPAVYEARTIC